MIDIVAAIVCIAGLTGLPTAPPPDVVVGSQVGWAREWPKAVGLYWPGVARVDGRGIVWVQAGYEHMIVHELVHHLQDKAGRTIHGDEAEAEAERVQWEFWAACPEAQAP